MEINVCTLHWRILVKKVKEPLMGLPSHSYGASLAMGSHSVTCHPTQVNAPHLNPSQFFRFSEFFHWYSIYLPRVQCPPAPALFCFNFVLPTFWNYSDCIRKWKGWVWTVLSSQIFRPSPHLVYLPALVMSVVKRVVLLCHEEVVAECSCRCR